MEESKRDLFSMHRHLAMCAPFGNHRGRRLVIQESLIIIKIKKVIRDMIVENN